MENGEDSAIIAKSVAESIVTVAGVVNKEHDKEGVSQILSEGNQIQAEKEKESAIITKSEVEEKVTFTVAVVEKKKQEKEDASQFLAGEKQDQMDTEKEEHRQAICK